MPPKKDKQTGLPQKYVPKSLTPTQKRKQVRSIREGTERPKLKGVKSRRSPYTIKAQKYFGEGKTSKTDMSQILSRGNKTRETQLKKGFDEIYDKGMEAYRTSGSRPNTTPQQWGQARVFSVLFGGPARNIDKDIVKRYKIPLLKS